MRIGRIQSLLAVKVFFCYSSKDEQLRRDLDTSLAMLKREKKITIWYDRCIPPGEEWEREISSRLESAGIILLLLSPDFLASDYIYEREMNRAFELRDAGKACVIPIVLRPCAMGANALGNLQALPRGPGGHRPIVNWSSQDEAFLKVAEGIRAVVEELAPKPFGGPSQTIGTTAMGSKLPGWK